MKMKLSPIYKAKNKLRIYQTFLNRLKSKSIKMKTTMIPILAVLIIQAVQAADVLRRQRRDLIGYNRQQNNVLGHIRYIEGDNDDKRK